MANEELAGKLILPRSAVSALAMQMQKLKAALKDRGLLDEEWYEVEVQGEDYQKALGVLTQVLFGLGIAIEGDPSQIDVDTFLFSAERFEFLQWILEAEGYLVHNESNQVRVTSPDRQRRWVLEIDPENGTEAHSFPSDPRDAFGSVSDDRVQVRGRHYEAEETETDEHMVDLVAGLLHMRKEG